MSAPKYTPGPHHYEHERIWESNKQCALAHVFCPEGDVATMDANGKLYAAAPQLVGALREICCWVGQGTTAQKAGAKCETMSEALDMVASALRAAGVQP